MSNENKSSILRTLSESDEYVYLDCLTFDDGDQKYYDPEFIRNTPPKIDPFEEFMVGSKPEGALKKLMTEIFLSDRKIGGQEEV